MCLDQILFLFKQKQVCMCVYICLFTLRNNTLTSIIEQGHRSEERDPRLASITNMEEARVAVLNMNTNGMFLDGLAARLVCLTLSLGFILTPQPESPFQYC